MKKHGIFAVLLALILTIPFLKGYGIITQDIHAVGGGMAGGTLVFVPEANVILLGEKLGKDQFEFSLKQVSSAGPDAKQLPGGHEEQIKNNADGNILWSPILFNPHDVGKTFYYRMQQVIPQGSTDDMLYDNTVVDLTVTVTKDSESGALRTDSTYSVNGSQLMDKPSFINKIGQKTVFVPLSTMILKGRDLKEAEFAFTLEQIASPDATATMVPGGLVASSKNSADGRILWGPIEYSEQDAGKTYYYRMDQVIPGQPEDKVSYDQTVVVISVKIVMNNEGKPGTEVVYKVGDQQLMDVPVFVNEIKDTVQFTPSATVSLDGREMKKGEFGFFIQQIDAEKDPNGAEPKPVEDGLQNSTENDADGNIRWEPIQFDQDDAGNTYYYKIAQIIPDDPDPNIDQDQTSYYLKLTIDQDHESGDLTVDAQYSDGTKSIDDVPHFANTVKAGVELVPMGRVDLQNETLKAGEFAFTLEQIVSASPDAQLTSNGLSMLAVNAADGQIKWGSIPYDWTDLGQEFYYRMKQVIPPDAGPDLGYDQQVVIVTVRISKDESSGGGKAAKLVATEDYEINGQKLMDQPSFENIYNKPAPTPSTTPSTTPTIHPSTTGGGGQPVTPGQGNNALPWIIGGGVVLAAGIAGLIIWLNRRKG